MPPPFLRPPSRRRPPLATVLAGLFALLAAPCWGQESPPLPSTVPAVGLGWPASDAAAEWSSNAAGPFCPPQPAGPADLHAPSGLSDPEWRAAVAQSEHPWLLRIDDFLNRSPETHGRSVGFGGPLRGTSWRNRPFAVAYQFGAFVMPTAPASDAQTDNDLFGSLHFAHDFDHYWGVEFRVGLSTPELNPAVEGARRSDTLTLIDLSTTYYPWGDSRTRPFLRLGVGLTDLEFTTGGARQQESLLTVPIGIGVKHLAWRATAWRAEVVNNLALGSNSADTLSNLTLTFGLEHRFGGTPPGYWAWRPRGTVDF